MKQVFLLFLGLIVAFGVVSIVYFGTQKSPTLVLPAKVYATPEEMQDDAAAALVESFESEPLVFFGVGEDQMPALQLIKHLIAEASAQKERHVLVPDLYQEGWNEAGVSLKEGSIQFLPQGEFLAALENLLATKTAAFVVMPLQSASPMVPGSDISRLRQKMRAPFTTVSVARLVVRREGLDQIEDCPEKISAGAVYTILPCAQQYKARSHFKNEWTEADRVLLVEEYGENDFVLFLHPPSR